MPTKDVGNCCFCIPLRTGVGLLCWYHFFHAFICIVGIFSADIRLQSGGYNLYTDRLQVTVGAFGIIFAVVGLLGIHDNKVGLVRTYNYFQYTKLLVSLLVFAADMWELQKCDNWINDIHSQLVPNQPLLHLSNKGLCPWARAVYTLGFGVDFGLNLYFAVVSMHYCNILATMPASIISFDNVPQHVPQNHSNHLHVRFFNATMGEPAEYFPLLHRPQDDAVVINRAKDEEGYV